MCNFKSTLNYCRNISCLFKFASNYIVRKFFILRGTIQNGRDKSINEQCHIRLPRRHLLSILQIFFRLCFIHSNFKCFSEFSFSPVTVKMTRPHFEVKLLKIIFIIFILLQNFVLFIFDKVLSIIYG